MKASPLAVVATGIVVLLTSFAGTKTSPGIKPESLARLEAITSYCATIDPQDQHLFLSKLSDSTRGDFPGEIQAERNTTGYRDALLEANKTLAQASSNTGVQGCTEFLAEK